ncbi:MAG: iron-sulfur cluster assembly scaffold protein [Desulfobacula sp. RIFOXYB2_FULL_45_6]|nr:MAG: iron-sulfur cluster assembly scaffold protein [Desulfobacula sp. RIFOXYB2_FULL_45_6]
MTQNKLFDFWNDHSLEFLEMAMKRDYQERVQTCDGYGKKTRDCGDTIEFFVNGNKDILDTISYDLKGCLFSHACANTIIFLARYKDMEQARHITPEDIVQFLRTLPREEEHCAAHVLGAFRMALDDLENKEKKFF